MKTNSTILTSLFTLLFITGCNNGGTKSYDSNNTNTAPIAEYAHTQSPNGPDASLDELTTIKNNKSINGLKIGKNTYTYIRCYYTKNSNKEFDQTITTPETDYIWAKDVNNNNYKLNGYWNSDGITDWSNMFFTSTPLSEIQQICDRTLSIWSNNEITHSFYQVAADNRYSFNYSIWQYNDTKESSNQIDKIISFGDSLTDSNNIYNASAWAMPNKKSWFQGRFTNGYTWAEYLSKEMKVPIHNWAVAGSEGKTKYAILSGLNDQIKSWANYMHSAKNYDVKRTLFTVLIGGNDFVNDDRSADDVANDVKTALTTLGKHGAKNVLLMNLPDITKAPIFHASKDPAKVYPKIIAYNDKLRTLVQEMKTLYPSMNVMLFDSKAELDKIIANPAAYGFDNTSDSCLNINGDSMLNYAKLQLTRSSCTDASKFVFWDTLHPTTATHRILATETLLFVGKSIKLD
ncbi:MAG: SGNH/GDSL hydrolase family protein [Burkholderiales bacterium]|nr:SGNH/GDSL hydrolase family protein [Burkholderiales bacterium]